MAVITCKSATATAGVVDGTIMRPLSGVLTADLRLDQPSGTGFAPGTAVTISGQNGYSIAGTVDPNRAGDFLDTVHVRILGGAGGMDKPTKPRSYVQPGAFAKDVIGGLTSDAGETLSATVDKGFLSSNLAAWSTVGGKPVRYNVRVLLQIVAPTFNWRFLPDGTLWIGAETWPQASGTFDIISIDPSDGSYELGQESPFILPGTNLPGVGNVNRVLDKIEKGQMRSRVWTDFGAGDRGVAPAGEAIAKQAMAGIDYYALYICQVVSQSADLTTMDVQPQGARNKALFGGPQRVPCRFGTGIKQQPVVGSTVLLGWDGGNPEQPFVLGGLSGDSVQSIQLGGADPVITKQDLTALINAISSATYVLATGPGVTGGTATALVFSPPGTYGSTTVGAGR